jgi:hypothetical protein
MPVDHFVRRVTAGHQTIPQPRHALPLKRATGRRNQLEVAFGLDEVLDDSADAEQAARAGAEFRRARMEAAWAADPRGRVARVRRDPGGRTSVFAQPV